MTLIPPDRFLTSITNTTIADKVTRSKSLPQNPQQCFEKTLRLEASLQLSEGVNMARRTMVMNIDLKGSEETNLVRDARARSNSCYKCSEVGHFQRNCKYDGDKPTDNQQSPKQTIILGLLSSCGRKVDDQFSNHHSHYSKGHEKLVC